MNYILNIKEIIEGIWQDIRILKKEPRLSCLKPFADNDAALTAGLKVGDFYINTTDSTVSVVYSPD